MAANGLNGLDKGSHDPEVELYFATFQPDFEAANDMFGAMYTLKSPQLSLAKSPEHSFHLNISYLSNIIKP